MSDWNENMDEAPRGEEVLISDGCDVAAAIAIGQGLWCWYASVNGNTIWEGGDRGGLAEIDFQPTHWQPLPPPPGADT